MSLVYTIIEPPDSATSRLLMERTLQELQRCGITTIHDIEGEPSLDIFHSTPTVVTRSGPLCG